MYLRSAGAVPPISILHQPESDPHGRWKAHGELAASWIGILRKEDIFALYIAAVGHDVGHPGFNNIFMVRGSSVFRALISMPLMYIAEKCTDTAFASLRP